MDEDPATVHLGLTYDPARSAEWVGPTYADYAAQFPADPPIWTPEPVRTSAVIAWSVAVVALFVVLNRTL